MQPRSHTIIEAHPDVYKYACSQGWDKKPGVRLVQGRWQDVIDEVSGQVSEGSASLAYCVLWSLRHSARRLFCVVEERRSMH